MLGKPFLVSKGISGIPLGVWALGLTYFDNRRGSYLRNILSNIDRRGLDARGDSFRQLGS